MEDGGRALEGVGGFGFRAFGDLGGFAGFGFGEIFFEGGGILGGDGFTLGRSDGGGGDEAVGVDGGHERVGGDFLVENRLREGGLVGLVVPATAETIHVDEHVAVEFLAEFEGELGDHADRFGVIAVHVENGGLDHLGDVGAVARGASVNRIGGKADLVVDHEVEGAAGAVAGELGEVEGLGDDALTGDGGVTVDQEGEDFGAVLGVAADTLAGAGAALDDGVDDLKVGRIGG